MIRWARWLAMARAPGGKAGGDSPSAHRDTGRLVAFSDAVFAITGATAISRRFQLALAWLTTGALLGAVLPVLGGRDSGVQRLLPASDPGRESTPATLLSRSVEREKDRLNRLSKDNALRSLGKMC
jgi:hypothetical protein